MTTLPPSLSHASAHPSPPSLADLIAHIEADETLPMQRRRDLCSAIRIVARAMDRRPEEISADPVLLRPRLKAITPAQAGVLPARWRNVISLLGFALEHAGGPYIRGRSKTSLSEGWIRLKARCDDKHLWTGISRFVHWCTDEGIEPADVTPDTFVTFHEALTVGLLGNKHPAITHRVTSRSWNKAAGSISGWPDVRVPMGDNRKKYILPWETFPETLKAEFDAYILDRSAPDPLGEKLRPPLKPSSVTTRTYHMREYIAVLVRVGEPPSELRTLWDILRPARVKAALLAFQKGKEPSNTRQAHSIATLLRSLAFWSGGDEECLAPLRGYCKRLESKVGMTDKNLSRLRQFDDPKVMSSVVNLPRVVFDRKAGRLKPYRRALEVQTAIMVEFLLQAPIRIGNLVALDLEQHLCRFGKNGPYHLCIPADEVKNGVELRIPLPDETSRLIDIYLKKYRPALLDGASNAVFPGRDSGHKGIRSVSGNIAKFLLQECGIAFNAHAFRHLAAYNFLKAFPGQYEVVRRLLGHRNLETTIRYYCGLETQAAFQQYNEVMNEKRRLANQPKKGNRK
jgi:integrase